MSKLSLVKMKLSLILRLILMTHLRHTALGKVTKYPALNLSTCSNADESKSKKSEEIRINKYYGAKRDRFYLKNIGNCVISFRFEAEESTSEATIRGPGWKDEFVFAKGHAFWSLDDRQGSQHIVDGQAYALEMQLVHFLKSAGSLENAVTLPNAVMVAVLLFEATGHLNTDLKPISDAIITFQTANTNWKQVHGPLDLKMLYPTDMSYLTYTGPLAIEPAASSAIWYIVKAPGEVSLQQLENFRRMLSDEGKQCDGIFDQSSTGVMKKEVKCSEGTVYMKVVKQAVLNGSNALQSNMVRVICYLMINAIWQTVVVQMLQM